LLRRAELTAKLIGLFAKLDKSGQLTIQGTPVTPIELAQMASQICENQRLRISPKRNIRLQCDSESFLQHAPSDLSADPDLLLQALNNLVDNAVKYSYSNTVIKVFCALLKRGGGFFIAVTNKGLPIAPREVSLVCQRHWRGEKAEASVGEGNGLGLWIADNIMRAHGGELQVLPTKVGDGVTQVRLAFLLAGNKIRT
jgi:signal transduction histidine kinase